MIGHPPSGGRINLAKFQATTEDDIQRRKQDDGMHKAVLGPFRVVAGPNVQSLRKRLGMPQEQFATAFRSFAAHRARLGAALLGPGRGWSTKGTVGKVTLRKRLIHRWQLPAPTFTRTASVAPNTTRSRTRSIRVCATSCSMDHPAKPPHSAIVRFLAITMRALDATRFQVSVQDTLEIDPRGHRSPTSRCCTSVPTITRRRTRTAGMPRW
jgi:hypothetical protein